MRFCPPEWHDILSSTSTVLRERAARDPALPSGFVLAAREQTAGRGRHGRRWISAPGRDLLFSFLLRTPDAPDHLPSLPQAVALGVAEALESLGVAVALKWPNDVLANGRKLAGILVERAGESGGEAVCVIGVGVNIGLNPANSPEIAATSLNAETGRAETPEDVLASILGRLSRWITHWESGGFPALRNEWERLALPVGRAITIGHGARTVSGTLDGYGDRGELRLRLADGTVRAFWSGDLDETPA